jgi:hypothetical protein
LARVVFYVSSVVVALVLLLFIDGPVAAGILTGIATGFLVPLADAVAQNLKYLKLGIASVRFRNQYVRVSFSYLFRIEDQGRYLLVRGKRFAHQMQPVGGVYKLSGTAKQRLREWEVQDDDLIPLDETSENDIRLRVPGRHLLSFVRWFERGTDRETSPWREFSEELLRAKLLPTEEFPYIYHNFVRRIHDLRFSDYAQSRELLVADIYELLPTPAQLAALRATREADYSDDLAWVSADQIRRRGAMPDERQATHIAETATWTL